MVTLPRRSFPFTSLALALLLALLTLAPRLLARPAGVTRGAELRASILVYHRFGPVVSDGMTVRTATFRRHLEYLHAHAYTVIPFRTLVAFMRGEGPPPPPRSVVITVDDGHTSVFTEMWPAVRESGVPVTLFIYPSAISNASYAMTWDQLRTLRATGQFDIESHTYWHPNFNIEKRRLAPDAYRDFARTQFCKAASVLRAKAGADPTLMSWPFGIVDRELFPIARDCGYVAGVTLERRTVTSRDDLMALPRFLVTDNAVGPRFAAMLPPEEAR